MKEDQKPKTKKPRVMNITALQNKTFHTLAFTGHWKELFGSPERNFRAILHGGSGCGKSTFALQLADYLSLTFNAKVFYNSWEEGLNQTIQDRANFVQPKSKKLFIGDRVSFEDMVEMIKKRFYRFIIIDSTQFANFTYDQYKQLTALYPKKSFIFVSQASGRNKTDGANKILFACDCKLYFNKGVVVSASRFNPKDVSMRLFVEEGDNRNKQQQALWSDQDKGIKIFNPQAK